MRITAVEGYGLRCLLVLASKGTGQQLSITEIANMEGLSVPYTSKLLTILRRAGLVKAVRGRSGGFIIAREPKDISLYEVLTLLGGPLIDPDHCQRRSGQRETCVHLESCSLHDVLGGLASFIQEFLMDTTLADVTSGNLRGPGKLITGKCTIARSALKKELQTMKPVDFDKVLDTLPGKD